MEIKSEEFFQNLFIKIKISKSPKFLTVSKWTTPNMLKKNMDIMSDTTRTVPK